jgi:hypothetical protein
MTSPRLRGGSETARPISFDPALGATAADQTMASARWVYAVGQVGTRCLTEGVERELRQAMGGTDPMDIANLARLRAALTKPENRYLVRELCWVLAVDGIDSYVLAPSDPMDILLLAEAIRPNSRGDNIDAAVGRIVDPSPADAACSQIPLPLLVFDQLHSFDTKSFAKKLKGSDAQEVEESFVVDVLHRLTSLGSGLGLAAEHRALNYVILRYPKLYHLASEKAAEGFSLQAVRFLRPPVAGGRILVDVLLTFISNVDSRTERWSVKVDVTDKYPFLRGALSPHLLTH